MNTQIPTPNYSARSDRTQGLFLNPLIRKLSQIKAKDDNCASYAGILGKCMFFMLMICLGVALAVIFNGANALYVDPVTHEVMVAKYAIILICAAVAIFIVFPLIAALIRVTIPVTGSLYCVSTGYILSFLMILDVELRAYLLLALVLTLAIVAVMAFLFFKGWIQVDKKFKAAVSSLFGAVILASLVLFACNFVPVLSEGISVLTKNPVISIGASITGVVIATMFLLIDFDTMRQTVEDRLPKKYEWFAAFALVFTVVWLYFKVLDLLRTIKGDN